MESKDIASYKELVEPRLVGYEIKDKHFTNGDFGDLQQIEFNSSEFGGEIDFWSSGYLGMHFVNYLTGEVLINTFLPPEDVSSKVDAFLKLSRLLELKK